LATFGFFDPRVGGDPVLFPHLVWFYSHPAVYIMVLPAMGFISELVAAGSARRCSATASSRFASLAIALLGFLVWGHHMFVAGESVYAAMIFRSSASSSRFVSGQGLQLDGDDVPWVGVVADADAVSVRIHRTVYDRRADRIVFSPRSASTST